MANELMLPPYLRPSQIELELVDVVGAFQPAFGYATTQRIDYGATRWHAKATFEKLYNDERHALLAHLARVGRVGTTLIPVYGEGLRGVGPFTELLNPTNPFFANSLSGWVSGGTGDLSIHQRLPRCTINTPDTGALTSMRNNPGTSVISTGLINFPHVMRTVILPGLNTAATSGFTQRQGSSNDGSEYGSATATYGYNHAVFTPSSTFLSCQVRENNANRTTGDYYEFPFFSASQIGLVSVSSQTGTGLRTAGWVGSYANMLAAGDFVNIALPSMPTFLARLTAPLHTTSGGLGYLQFQPQLPEVPNSGAAVIPYNPLLKVLVSDVPKVRTRPPGYQTDVEVTFAGVFA